MSDRQPPRALDLGEPLRESELCPDQLLGGQEEAFARDVERLLSQSRHFVQSPCPACGGSRHEAAFDKLGFTYVRCQDCSTLFMNPRPSPEIMAAYYADSENYRYWAQHIFPASEAVRRAKLHKPWLQRVADYCRRFGASRGTLLEVGPGFGTFSALAQESGLFDRVLAVEPTPEMAKACRERGVEVLERRIEEVAEDGPLARVLVAFEVLEHLFAPRQLLEQAYRLLEPGGLLVLSCPNGQGFDITQLKAEALAVDPEHVNLLNPASLRGLAESSGFEVLDVATPGRLDAEFVREAWRQGRFTSEDPFLRRVLLDDWERLGWPFQQFLAQQGLSSHMWLAARKPEGRPAAGQEDGACEAAVASCYSTWSQSYYQDYYASPKAYPPVHRQIARDLLRAHGARSILDAGCGPASMLRDLTDLGAALYGFDLTPQMVEEARRVMAGHGVAAEHIWQGSVLRGDDFINPALTGLVHDAVICFGVLPHIPAEHDHTVLVNLRQAVRPGGLALLEARNQLFALFSLNRYSHDLFADVLIQADRLRALAGPESAALEQALTEMASHFRLDQPPARKGRQGEPGYDEVLSRTHNPLELKRGFEEAGFREVELLFYHYHCLPPMLEAALPELFRRESLAREDPRDWRGHFMASAFIVKGVRA